MAIPFDDREGSSTAPRGPFEIILISHDAVARPVLVTANRQIGQRCSPPSGPVQIQMAPVGPIAWIAGLAVGIFAITSAQQSAARRTTPKIVNATYFIR